MKYEKLLLEGDIDVNCYIIINKKKCFIIDPGYQKEKLQNFVKKRNLQPTGILLTHGHIDHIGALDAFKVPLYIHKKEIPLLKNVELNGYNHFGKKFPYQLKNINICPIDENTVLTLEEEKIEIIHTPGHTSGGVCYLINKDMFTGDTLFRKVVGRWDFPTGSFKEIKKSILKLINDYPPKIRIHPGHGESSTLSKEKKDNHYYLRWK